MLVAVVVRCQRISQGNVTGKPEVQRHCREEGIKQRPRFTGINRNSQQDTHDESFQSDFNFLASTNLYPFQPTTLPFTPLSPTMLFILRNINEKINSLAQYNTTQGRSKHNGLLCVMICDCICHVDWCQDKNPVNTHIHKHQHKPSTNTNKQRSVQWKGVLPPTHPHSHPLKISNAQAFSNK